MTNEELRNPKVSLIGRLSLGEAIRRVRLLKFMTAREVALDAGIGPNAVSRLERDPEADVTVGNLLKIMAALCCKPDDIFLYLKPAEIKGWERKYLDR